jgi:hypothetical protein
MKTKTTLLLLLMFVGATCFAQPKLESWKELKDFHEVMSATYHPSQENNLKPIKARATEMKDKALALSNANVPAEFNTDQIKASVKKLQGQCVTLEKMVNSKVPDKDITKHLAMAHDSFHEIVGLCSGGEEHEKEGQNIEGKEKEEHAK